MVTGPAGGRGDGRTDRFRLAAGAAVSRASTRAHPGGRGRARRRRPRRDRPGAQRQGVAADRPDHRDGAAEGARAPRASPETTNAPGPSPNSRSSPWASSGVEVDVGAAATRRCSTRRARRRGRPRRRRAPSAARRTRTPRRTAACSARSSPRSAGGSVAGQRLAAQLGQLRAGRRRRPGARGDDGDGIAVGREAEPPGRRASGSSPTIPTTGVG